MANAVTRDDLARSRSREAHFALSSTRGWASASFRGELPAQRSDALQRLAEEEELKWAAIERLPTYTKQVLENGSVIHEETMSDVLEDDRLRQRMDRVGINVPKCEIRFEYLAAGDTVAGSRKEKKTRKKKRTSKGKLN